MGVIGTHDKSRTAQKSITTHVRRLATGAVCILCAIAAWATLPVRAEDSARLKLDAGGHLGQLWKMTISPDGKELITLGDDEDVRVWDVETGKSLRMITTGLPVSSAGFSQDGKIFIAGLKRSVLGKADMHDIVLYDLTTGARMKQRVNGEDIHWGPEQSAVLELSPDNKTLLISVKGGDTVLWDLDSKRLVFKLFEGISLSQMMEGALDVKKTQIGSQFVEKLSASLVSGAWFNKDGQRLITASSDNALRLRRVKDGGLIAEMRGHKEAITTLAFSPDDATVASADENSEIRLWSAQTGAFLKALPALGAKVSSLSFTPDGGRLMSAGKSLNVWDVATGAQISVGDDPRAGTIGALRATPGGMVAASRHLLDFEVWEPVSGKSLGRLKGEGGPITDVAFSADNRSIAWSTDVSCLHRDLDRSSDDKTESASPAAECHPVLNHQFHLSLDEDPLGAPENLDKTKPQEWRKRVARSDPWSVSYVPANNYEEEPASAKPKANKAASKKTSGQKILRKIDDPVYWDHLEVFNNGKLAGKTDNLYDAGEDIFGLTPGGRTVLWASTAYVSAYDIDGFGLGRFEGHLAKVTSFAPSPNRHYLVTGSLDRTVRLWNMKCRCLVASLFGADGGEWVIWTPQGYYAASPGGDRFVGWKISRGEGQPQEYVPAAQLKKHYYRPDVVANAIDLADAWAAAQEVKIPFQQTELTRRFPPRFAVVSPADKSNTDKATVAVTVQVDANPDPIKGFEASVNGRQISTRDDRGMARPNGDAFAKTFEVPLEKGENRIRVSLSNDVGDTAKELLVTHAGAASASLDKRGALYVVAVGVDAYTKVTPLNFAGADAKAFRDAIAAKAEPLYSSVKSVVLAKGGDKEPTRANIEDAMDLFRDAKPEDTVMMFLAGHGVNDGPDYLFLPQDASSDGERWKTSSVIKWYNLQLALQSTQGRRILFVDTCHAGGAFNPRLIKDAADAQIIVFSATDDKTLAQERPELGHGVFTHALVAGINGEADLMKHGAVNLFELNSYVAQKVKTLTNNAQEPTIHLSGAKDFVIAAH